MDALESAWAKVREAVLAWSAETNPWVSPYLMEDYHEARAAAEKIGPRPYPEIR
jgi:hypothetical protein